MFYRRNRFGPGRPWRHIGWIVWVLPFLFFGSYHSWFTLMMGLFFVFIISMVVWSVISGMPSGSSRSSSWIGQPWNQPQPTPPPVSPTYQPYDPYQGSEPYASYHQGYRAQSGPQPAAPASPVSRPEPARPLYDQPEMEYPREEPPMVQ
jgi:hypothetical protein